MVSEGKKRRKNIKLFQNIIFVKDDIILYIQAKCNLRSI